MQLSKFKDLFPNEYFSDVEVEFLKQSNYIESEYSNQALIDALYAWDFMRNSERFNVWKLLHCHFVLLRNIEFCISGHIRNQNVWVGGCLKPFISEQLIRNDLEHLFDKMNRFEIEPKAAHIEFEFIHPFVDGNGRVGRILYNAHRISVGQPIHIIKESEKNEYYNWF